VRKLRPSCGSFKAKRFQDVQRNECSAVEQLIAVTESNTLRNGGMSGCMLKQYRMCLNGQQLGLSLHGSIFRLS